MSAKHILSVLETCRVESTFGVEKLCDFMYRRVWERGLSPVPTRFSPCITRSSLESLLENLVLAFAVGALMDPDRSGNKILMDFSFLSTVIGRSKFVDFQLQNYSQKSDLILINTRKTRSFNNDLGDSEIISLDKRLYKKQFVKEND